MRSLSNRLTLRIMMVVLAMMAVIAGVVYFTVGEYMDDEAEQRFQVVLMRSHREIQRKLSDIYVATTNNIHEIERDIDDPDKLSGHLERIVRQNPGIVSCGLLFVPDYYPEKGRFFVPFASRDTADMVSVMRIDSVYHDYFDDDWFVERMESDSADWVEPYFEDSLLTTNIAPRLLTTYAIPIHNHKGRPVALLCSDLSLEDLRNEMLQHARQANKNFEKRLKHQSYSVVTDRNGRFLIHPDKARMLKDSLDAEIPFDDKMGAASVTIDGVPSWVYHRRLKYTEWIVMMVVPKDVIQQNGRMLNIIILAVMLIGLVAIYLFCRQQIKEIADPFAAKKAAMERELNIARDIQNSMVPGAFPKREGLDVYASMTPAKEVGGDLYDYFIRDNRLFFCIGDVAGKGVPAALFMSTAQGDFRLLAESESEPVRIVTRMNNVMARDNNHSVFVTFFAGVLDLETGHLSYCNAGHNAPFVLIDNTPCSTLDVNCNLPVAAMPDFEFTQQETTLAPGTTLFLYTDGLDEAEDATHNMFGNERIIEVLQSTANDPQTLIERMKQAVADFTGDTEQSDDLTLLALQWK